ncbi:MAG: hypothetical protein ACRCZC_07640 [Culicoidibacterales bacterium]
MEQLRQESTADMSSGIGKISRLGLELELLLIFTDSNFLAGFFGGEAGLTGILFVSFQTC